MKVTEMDDEIQQLLHLRSRIEISESTTICHHHYHLYITSYKFWHRYCCDPSSRHRKGLKKKLRTLSLEDVREIHKRHPTFKLIPGQKLCPPCFREYRFGIKVANSSEKTYKRLLGRIKNENTKGAISTEENYTRLLSRVQNEDMMEVVTKNSASLHEEDNNIEYETTVVKQELCMCGGEGVKQELCIFGGAENKMIDPFSLKEEGNSVDRTRQHEASQNIASFTRSQVTTHVSEYNGESWAKHHSECRGKWEFNNEQTDQNEKQTLPTNIKQEIELELNDGTDTSSNTHEAFIPNEHGTLKTEVHEFSNSQPTDQQNEENSLETSIGEQKRSAREFYQCDECPWKSNIIVLKKRSYVSKKSVKQLENKSSSPQKNRYYCDECNYSFSAMIKLERHKRAHSKRRQNELRRLEKHKEEHLKSRRYECDQCDFKCTFMRELEEHKKEHSSRRLYGCDEYDYQCLQPEELESHKRAHEVERSSSAKEKDATFILVGMKSI